MAKYLDLSNEDLSIKIFLNVCLAQFNLNKNIITFTCQV